MIVHSDYLQEVAGQRRRRRMGAAIALGGILCIGAYFFYQMRDWVLLPSLSLLRPQPGAVVRGPEVMVEGAVTPGVHLTINGQKTYSEETGSFETALLLPEGLHTIRAVAENRFGRSRVIERQIVVR